MINQLNCCHWYRIEAIEFSLNVLRKEIFIFIIMENHPYFAQAVGLALRNVCSNSSVHSSASFAAKAWKVEPLGD